MINLKLQKSTGIYVGAKEVYVAQVQGTVFGPRLLKFGKAEIRAVEQADESARKQAIVQAVRQAMQENRLPTKRVFTALPGKDVLIRYFQMPKIPRSEWKTAIKFEAKKYVPFKIEELMWDYHVGLSKGREPKMDVTFVGVKRTTAQGYLSLLEQADLTVSVLEPAPFSLLRLFGLSNQLAKDKPTAIVDIDYEMADINIVKNKSPYLTRDVSLPQELEVVFETLLNEIRMSLDYYEKQFPIEVIGKILLCGAVELGDWDVRLAEELRLPVEKLDIAKAIKVSKALPSLSMACAIGLALRGLSHTVAEVNLLQIRETRPEVMVRKEGLAFTPEIRGSVIRAVVLSIIGLLILHLVMFQRVAKKRGELEQVVSLRPEIGLQIGSLSYEKIAEVKQQLENKLSTLKVLVDKRVFWTNKFNELPKLIPPGIWLTDLSFTDNVQTAGRVERSLNIKGVAYHENPVQEIGIVTKFVSNLKENAEFARGLTEIKLDTMSSQELQNMPVKNFSISCVTR